jgi:hypothetical protein
MITLILPDPNDPEVIIKIDMSNVFNSTCRPLTLDVLSDVLLVTTFVVSKNAIPHVRTMPR